MLCREKEKGRGATQNWSVVLCLEAVGLIAVRRRKLKQKKKSEAGAYSAQRQVGVEFVFLITDRLGGDSGTRRSFQRSNGCQPWLANLMVNCLSGFLLLPKGGDAGKRLIGLGHSMVCRCYRVESCNAPKLRGPLSLIAVTGTGCPGTRAHSVRETPGSRNDHWERPSSRNQGTGTGTCFDVPMSFRRPNSGTVFRSPTYRASDLRFQQFQPAGISRRELL